MSTVFISSVIGGFEEYRQAAKEAVELLDYKPIMSEHFGARPYSSELACISEVEQSDVYLLILGERYGFETGEGVSVTQAEYRAARAAHKPILAFVQRCDMEPKQVVFREEVERYQEGVFRAGFETTDDLRDAVIKALRQFETASRSISEAELNERIAEALDETGDDWNSDPELILAVLPQPERAVDIVGLENDLDKLFQMLGDADLVRLRDGYTARLEAHWTGLKAGGYRLACFPVGMVMLRVNPTVENDSLFSGHFAPPVHIAKVACGFRRLIHATSGFCHIEMRNMSNTYVAPLPKGSSFSMKMWGEDRAAFNRLFVPLTAGPYQQWIDQCVRRLTRIFGYETN